MLRLGGDSVPVGSCFQFVLHVLLHLNGVATHDWVGEWLECWQLLPRYRHSSLCIDKINSVVDGSFTANNCSTSANVYCVGNGIACTLSGCAVRKPIVDKCGR